MRHATAIGLSLASFLITLIQGREKLRMRFKFTDPVRKVSNERFDCTE